MTAEAIADFSGAYAVWILAIVGCLTVLVMAALWCCLEKYGERMWRTLEGLLTQGARLIDSLLLKGRLHRVLPAEYLLLHFALGFAFVFAALTGFFELTEALDVDEELNRFDALLATKLRATLAPATYRFFAYATRLGDTQTLVALCSIVALLLAFRRQWLQLLGWSIAVIGNGLLTRALKALFRRLRPLHDHGFAVADGWSFPSGHAAGAVVVYGMLAYLVIRSGNRRGRLPLLLIAIALILIVGSSRIFLQVHFFSDVLAGFCSGAAWLAVCVAGTEIAWRCRARDDRRFIARR